MGAAVAPPPTFSVLYADAAKWSEPTPPDYTFYATRVGGTATGGGGLDRAATITTLVNLGTRSPTMVAFITIKTASTLDTPCLSIPAIWSTLPFDDSVVVLVGNEPGSCQPMVLPAASFARATGLRTKHHDYIIGIKQLTHIPILLHSGPWGMNYLIESL